MADDEMQTETEPALQPPPTMDEAEPAWQTLHTNYVTAERIASAILWAVLAAIAAAVLIVLIALVFSRELLFASVLCGGALLVLGLLAFLFWKLPLWNYQTVGWRESGRGFEIKRGIWWRHHIFIPRERIQHTDVVRGPLARKFGLATLVIHTAGTHNHEITLEGLEHLVAEKLRQSLLPQDDRGI